ncbi:MAG: response regulator [Bdellovibrionaceae bacterium]|nr:response regulator [Pseudobdellovibrionaceae bacterium]
MQARKKTLIVEDDEVFRQVLKTHLEAQNHEVRLAENGLVAKTILELTSFDLIISDLQMPVMNGLKLLEFVKEKTNSQFLLMTGFPELAEVRQAHELGVDGFLSKPFRKEELLRALAQIEEKTRSPGTVMPRMDPDYCQVEISDFISGSTLPTDIYLRLSDEKYIRLASQGQSVPTDRIEMYQAKGIEHFYMRKEDFARYVGFNMRLFTAVQGQPLIEIDRKMNFVRHLTDSLMENLCSGGFNRERLKDASSMVTSTVDLLLKNDDTTKLLDSILSAQSMSEHAIAVSMIASLIAHKHGWTARTTLFKVNLAGLFHDIGQKELPPELLTKKRFELSQSECALLESHTTRGRLILNSVPGMSEDIAAVAGQHHEMMSGGGYPQRLRGDQIHPLARLVAVADMFCDLVLTPPGTKGMPPYRAFEVLKFDYQRDFDQSFVNTLGQLTVRLAKNAAG